MKIVLGGDHSSIEHREIIKAHLEKEGHEVIETGTNAAKANYAICGFKVAENYLIQKADFGIAICGSGIGISIAANKVRGIRCALVYNTETANLARAHNNANVVALGSRFTTPDEAVVIIDIFIKTEFEKGRHLDRINTISDYEESCSCED